jgi:hypothetical protein
LTGIRFTPIEALHEVVEAVVRVGVAQAVEGRRVVHAVREVRDCAEVLRGVDVDRDRVVGLRAPGEQEAARRALAGPERGPARAPGLTAG